VKLLTKELKRNLPPLYSQEEVEDPVVIVKFFHPRSNWTWYAYEASAVVAAEEGRYMSLKEAVDVEIQDVLFFGLVSGLEEELGYFSLRELEGVKDGWGLGVERDLYFEPKRLSEVRKETG